MLLPYSLSPKQGKAVSHTLVLSQVLRLPVYLFVVGLNKAKDKPSVHDGQQIIEEKCKTGVEPFNHFSILNGRKEERMQGRKHCYIG